MTTFLERIGQLRQRLGDLESVSWRERLAAARQQLVDTQRILIDASTYGSLEHSRNVAIWYARLEVPMDASTDELTRSFRRLIRLYHPDRYIADEEHTALANELTQMLVTAYQGLMEHRGRY